MSALNNSPANPNFLSQAGFKFLVQRAPDLNFTVQKVNIPGISISPVSQPNPFVQIPHSGEHVEYEPLSVTFKVDENMVNWIAMHNWMRGLGFPNNFDEYKTLKTSSVLGGGKGIESDLKLFILTSHRNVNFEITFRNAFPINLSGLDFDSTLSDIDYIESTVSFEYVSYAIETTPL